MNQPPPGHVSREFTFWCGICYRWRQVTHQRTMRGAIAEAKVAGWRLTKGHGWICPVCAKDPDGAERSVLALMDTGGARPHGLVYGVILSNPVEEIEGAGGAPRDG